MEKDAIERKKDAAVHYGDNAQQETATPHECRREDAVVEGQNAQLGQDGCGAVEEAKGVQTLTRAMAWD